MPHEVIRAPEHNRSRSLGWLATSWIESMCIHGPGDVADRPLNVNLEGAIPLSNELVSLTVDAYALNASGRRLYDSVFYSRPKGSNKSGYAAWLVCFEALGPCRFAGFAEGGEVFEQMDFRYEYQKGEPMGRPIVYPFIRILATEEKQVGNVYDALHYNLLHGPLRMMFDREDDIGLGRVYLPGEGGGEIRPDTASSAAKDGGKESFIVPDETHLYYKPELIRMYDTVTRNLAKRAAAEPWSFEPTTMYEPGRGSIAEKTHKFAEQIREGSAQAPRLLFDHREAPAGTNIDDDDSLRTGLLEAYGDAADYMDIEGIMLRLRDPRKAKTDSAQFFLNQATAGGGKAFDIVKWDASTVEKTKRYRKAGEMIALGFDGSRTRDATSLKATHIASGFQWRIATWERPEHATPDWEVPEAEVDAAVDEAFRTYRVVLFYADTSKWEAAVARWAGKYNHEKDETKAIVVKWPVQLHKKTAVALKAYANAIANSEVLHGDDPVARRHLANAIKLPQNFTDDDGSSLWLIGKEKDPNKIDDSYAGMLSWQARNDAIARGVLNEAGPSVYESRGILAI